MSFWDWVTVIGICLAGVEVLALVGMFAWWFGSTLSEILEFDREIARERAMRDAERRARMMGR